MTLGDKKIKKEARYHLINTQKQISNLKPLLDEYWKYIENIYAAGVSDLAKAVT